MAKKVLVITSSMRRGGNSETLADEFARGAAEAGNSVEKIALADYELKFCKGCLACQKSGKCVIKDGTEQILAKMNEADVIAFATPIYYYEMSGQLKTMLDRSNPLFGTDYSFRDIYLFTSAADGSDEADERALVGLQGWIECFDKAELKGSILAAGVDAVGAVKGNPALERAYEMGRAVK